MKFGVSLVGGGLCGAEVLFFSDVLRRRFVAIKWTQGDWKICVAAWTVLCPVFCKSPAHQMVIRMTTMPTRKSHQFVYYPILL